MSKIPLDERFVSFTAPDSFEAEQYQGLRLHLERLRRMMGRAQVVGVTSAGLGDGKTLTSLNLAGALSQDPAVRVLLVDADLRRPRVAAHLRAAKGTRGLSELIEDETTQVSDVVWRADRTNLDVIAAGTPRGPVSLLFRSERFARVLQKARERYDFILMDTPPVLPVHDAALLTEKVDGLLLVIAAHRTPRKLVGEALNLLEPSKVLGIVLNGDRHPLFGYYGRRYRKYFVDRSDYTPAA